MLTRKKILREVTNSNLDLEVGNGYFYFIYDDEEKNLYETRSVWVNSINQLDLDSWIYEANELIKKMEN